MSGCQRLAIRRRASCTSRTSNGGSRSRSPIACSRSKTVAICSPRYRTPTPYSPAPMAGEPIFQMYKLSKVYPPDREVLKDISLSFLPAAKIGVLGYNGSGKSSLLRIMAGQDTEFRGDAQLAPGATVGLLEQEPSLEADKDVRANVEDGVAE